MENTIILFPYAGQLTRSARGEAEMISRRPKQSASFRGRKHVQLESRSNSLIGISRQTERIYGWANLAAVVVMAAALAAAFGMYLISFVG
jgi:hypothetical protein